MGVLELLLFSNAVSISLFAYLGGCRLYLALKIVTLNSGNTTLSIYHKRDHWILGSAHLLQYAPRPSKETRPTFQVTRFVLYVPHFLYHRNPSNRLLDSHEARSHCSNKIPPQNYYTHSLLK